ncbi:MAG TPA: hypothetical protein VGE07_18565 [Herpetosiphonaceae bacterium]
MSAPVPRTIPLLPCVELDATMAFWQALGFTPSYIQRVPNPYVVLEGDGYHLHFFGLPQQPPEANYSCCMVLVSDVESIHRTFAERLRAHLGWVPGSGFPRISRMRPGQTRFTLTDISGNSIMFIKQGDEDEEAAQAYTEPGLAPLEKALRVAARLRDFKTDDAAAAKALDAALRHNPAEPSLTYARVLAARLELAGALGDAARAGDLRAQLDALPLDPTDRAAIDAELAAVSGGEGDGAGAP